MNWIRQEKRLAIYLRDGLACAYCGESVEQGAKLTLDHLKPHSQGGSNHETNLVTCCHRCNSSRGDRPVAEFAAAVAGYVNHGVTAEEILKQVRNCTARKLTKHRAEAKEMIARRGSAARVLAKMWSKERTMTTTYTHRLTDSNADIEVTSLVDAADEARNWYDYLVDDERVTRQQLDMALAAADAAVADPAKSLDALEAWIGALEDSLARAEGKKDWTGHGNYSVRAADEGGYNLRVEEIDDEDDT